VVASIQEETVVEALAEFCNGKVSSFFLVPKILSFLLTYIQCLPSRSQPYISAVSPNFVAVSGSPNIVDEFLSMPAFIGKKRFHAPIHGPYHTSNVYSKSDLERILDLTLDGISFLDREAHTPIISCASGAVIQEISYSSLLRDIITSCLVRQIRLSRVIDNLSDSLLADASVATLTPVNTQITSNLSNSLARRVLNAQTDKPIEFMAGNRAKGTTASDTSLDSGKIAIVGFSSRFPEADGLTEFWDLLRKDLDVHKPIPADRFDGQVHYDPKGQRENTSQV